MLNNAYSVVQAVSTVRLRHKSVTVHLKGEMSLKAERLCAMTPGKWGAGAGAGGASRSQ